MKSFISRVRRDDDGALTFEWILLITLLVIGVVGGVSAVRDAIISELGDVSAAVVNIDQSYVVTSCTCDGTVMGNSFSFQDTLPPCAGQGARLDPPVFSQGAVGQCSQ